MEEKIHKERFVFDFPLQLSLRSKMQAEENFNAPQPVLWIRILTRSDRHHFAGSGSLFVSTKYLPVLDACRVILLGAASAAKRMSVHGCGHLAQISSLASPTIAALWLCCHFYMLSLFRPVLGWNVYCSNYPQPVEKRSFSLSQACMFVVSD